MSDETKPSDAPAEGKVFATRMPADLARKVESAARSELISNAAFLRRAAADAVRTPKPSKP